MDLISVIIPTFNRDNWIGEAIVSILNQTYKEIQLLIIDDGSTDNTEEIVHSFKDSRVCYYKTQNKGISAALNMGLSKSDADYIARLDSDDYCVKNRLDIQYSFLKKNPEYGLTGSNFILVDEYKNELLKVHMPEKHKYIEDQLPRKCSLCSGTLLFHKNIFRIAGNYNEQKRAAEDWEFLLRLAGRTKFYNIQNYLVYIRKHSFNLSNESISFKIENERVPLKYFRSVIKSNPGKMRTAKAYFDIGYFFYYENELRKSKKLFSEAVKIEPLNLQYLRYYLFARFCKKIITLIRLKGWNKYWDNLRRLDRRNKYLRNKF